MKRKFSLFLNVAVLALCVCAIAIGVYSAKQATLNVSGTVGFTAHNCNVGVKASILGDSVAEDGVTASELGTPRTTATEWGNWEVLGSDKTGTLEKFYFCDMTENENPINPITITFEFSNKSDFMVNASITDATIDGVNIAKDKHAVVLMDKNAADENKTQSITFTLTLASNTQSFAEEKSLAISFKLEKYTGTALSTLSNGNNFFWNNVATNIRSYVTMGTYTQDSTTKDIRWYIFASGNSESSMNAITTNLDNNGYLPKGTYWFISEYVLENKAFQSAGTSNVYGTSDIKAYLDDNDASTTSDTKFTSVHSILSNNAVYSQITARTLPAEEASGNVGAFTAVPNQKLWLLSVNELACLNNNTQVTLYEANDNLIAYGTSSTASSWWLRSPNARYGSNAFYVRDGGYVDRTISYNNLGVRAAFQITIQG